MLCNKCKKRPAIVFVQRMENGEMKNEGYCLSCARELGIKPLDDIMKQFGISGEDLEAMEDRFAGMMENGDMDPSEMMQNMMGMGAEDAEDAGQDEEEETSDNGEERFVPGGAGTFPLGIFASRKKEEGEKKDPRAKEKGKKRKFLDNYCENLTQKARDGKLDAIIGRDREIYRTIQILSRRQKNNPCLIGEAGVGKTAIRAVSTNGSSSGARQATGQSGRWSRAQTPSSSEEAGVSNSVRRATPSTTRPPFAVQMAVSPSRRRRSTKPAAAHSPWAVS